MPNIVPNGEKIGDFVTLVGHKFDANNDSTLPAHLQDASRQRNGKAPLSIDRKLAEAERLNRKYAIAETCNKCSPPRPLIAEEVTPHHLKHAPNSTVRRVVGTVLQQSPDDQRLALEMLKELVK